MKEISYYYISIAYCSFAGLSAVGLVLKGYIGRLHRLDVYRPDYNVQKKRRVKYMDYMLHALHIPAYLMASYLYYDAYSQHKQID